MNQEIKQKLGQAVQYFQLGLQIGEKLEEEENKIDYLEENFRDDKESGEKPSKILKTIGYIGTFGGGGFLALMLIVALTGVKANKSDIALLTFLIPAFIASVCILFFSKILAKKAEEKFKKIRETVVQPQIDEAQVRHTELTEALGKYIEDNIHIIEFLPMQYRNLEAVSFMYLAISDGRADSLKEVYNLYEAQLHRWKLEEAAQQAAEAQEYMALAMEQLSERQAETNAHLRSIEFMQYMQYLNSKSND